MPFVQGHLWNTPVTVTIDTTCAHCAEPVRLEIDSDMQHRVAAGGVPLIFIPMVDFKTLEDPSIIDAF